MSFIYLLANYYKDFGKQNPELWAKQIVPFLGIEYDNYNGHKNQKDKSAATQYKDFMIQLEECLDRYNLLWEYGYDNRSLDEFMKRFIRKK